MCKQRYNGGVIIGSPSVAQVEACVNAFKLDQLNDKFIIVASDGVWEFLSSMMVAQIVGGFLARGEPAEQARRARDERCYLRARGRGGHGGPHRREQ